MFSGTTEAFQTLLVFRRSLEDEDDGGEILSVTPAAAQPEPIQQSEDRDPPVRAQKDDDAPKSGNEDDDPVAFDEDEIDPLKTLVEDHRKTKSE